MMIRKGKTTEYSKIKHLLGQWAMAKDELIELQINKHGKTWSIRIVAKEFTDAEEIPAKDQPQDPGL